MSKQWSSMQNNIFSFVAGGTGNAIVRAVAGSGKSTTIEEADRCIQNINRSSIFLAFNKAIAAELAARGVNGRTFHSLTFSVVTRTFGPLDTNKMFSIGRDMLDSQENFIYGRFVARLVSMGKQIGIGCLQPNEPMYWQEIIDHHAMEMDNEKGDVDQAIEYAMEMLRRSNEYPSVDFDDMLYLPVLFDLVLPKFDFVFIDEAQDTNAIQRALIRKLLKDDSRIIAVGDENQAIYGFRGASSDSMILISNEFDCIKLPLNVSYRCAKNIVKHAQKWVPDIEAAPGAPDGEVNNLAWKWELTSFKHDDLIVCRTTKPLVSLAFQFLKAKIPAKILGREIGQALKNVIVKLGTENLDTLEIRLEEYTRKQVQKALVKQDEARADSLTDQCEALICLIDSLEDKTLRGLNNAIDSLFSDKVHAVTLATIHKSKGLEAETVWWLNAHKCPAKWAKTDWQKQQEENLCYVATTRAKLVLNLIEEKPTGKTQAEFKEYIEKEFGRVINKEREALMGLTRGF